MTPSGLVLKMEYSRHLTSGGHCSGGDPDSANRDSINSFTAPYNATLMGCIEGTATVRLLTRDDNIELASVQVQVVSAPTPTPTNTPTPIPPPTATSTPKPGSNAASLSPDPSTVTFRPDGAEWRRFTVHSNAGDIRVVANPSGSQLRVEITGSSHAGNFCPPERSDTNGSRFGDGDAVYLAGCSVGTGTVELRRASNNSHIRTYTFRIGGTATATPTATPVTPTPVTPTPIPPTPTPTLNPAPLTPTATAVQAGAWLDPDPESISLGSQWKKFTLRTEHSEILVNVKKRSGALNLETGSFLPPVSQACRSTPAYSSSSMRDGSTFSLVGCQVGTATIDLKRRGVSDPVRSYTVTIPPPAFDVSFKKGLELEELGLGIGGNVVVDNGKQDKTVTPSLSSKSVQFNVSLYVSANSGHKRAYTVRVEAKRSGSEDWVPVDSIVKRDAASDNCDLPEYVYLGGGEAVWLEDSETTCNFVLRASLAPAPQQYRITISKPYIALMKPPEQVERAQEKTRGNVKVKLTIRNSSSGDSPGSDGIALYCVDPWSDYPIPSRYEFPLISGNETKEVDLATVCRGVLSPGTLVYARLDPTGDLQQTAKGSLSWPFGTRNTMWKPQSNVMGGLQIAARDSYDRACTSSFALRRLSNGTGTSTVSTTAHCAQASVSDTPSSTFRWRQGSVPLSAATEIADNGLMPSSRRCKIEGAGPLESSNCRKGDQAYATMLSSASSLNGLIFRPSTENTEQSPDEVQIGYFESSGVRFEVIGARPPDVKEGREGDKVHKVGRTTGWTSGELHHYGDLFGDPNCPGNRSGSDDNKVRIDFSYYYTECLVRVDYLADGGDSGSPVFVLEDDEDTSDVVEVILVGVHWGGRDDYKQFIPIDRIYAESLLEGYDWDTNELRPLPSLDPDDPNPIRLNADGSAIEAAFDEKLFSLGYGLSYEAALYRNGTQVVGAGSKEISSTTTTASFQVSDIPLNQRSGTFSVRVRMCVADIIDDLGTLSSSSTCSGYHDAGESFTPPPAPGTPTAARSGQAAKVSWSAVSNASEYQLGYRLSSGGDWEVVGGNRITGTSTPVTGFTCGEDSGSYEFRVRAKSDDSGTYDGDWGLWSGVSNAVTVPCASDEFNSKGVVAGSSAPTGSVALEQRHV